MNPLLRGLYSAAAHAAALAAAVAPVSDDKLLMALRARRGIRDRYHAWAAQHRDAARPLLWVHAASVGEAIMARPVLAAFRAAHPDTQIAFTFFSPSAEDFSRTLDVDFREYLPFDRTSDMAAALDALRPKALVFSKVDVWPELVREASARGVRLGLVSASLPEGSSRIGPISSNLLRDAYTRLDAVGAVDEPTAQRLVALGARRQAVEITGDTAFDVAWQRVTAEPSAQVAGVLERLRSARPTVVAGSTWPADEAHLLAAVVRARAFVPELRLVIAPHEMQQSHLASLETWAAANALASARVDSEAAATADVVIVDRFGLLAFLYGIGQVSFVGGGFHDAGLHSVVEPAAHATPVLFGPRHTRSRDAGLLMDAGGARSVRDADAIVAALRGYFSNAESRQATGRSAQKVVESGRGAVARSLALVERLLAS